MQIKGKEVCGARWLSGHEVFCQLEPQDPGKNHYADVKIDYENGLFGRVDVSWQCDANKPEQKEGAK